MSRPPHAADRSVRSELRIHRPLASLSRTGLEKLFHSWRGASGRRYICSIYPLGEPPVFDCAQAVVAAVRRDGADATLLFAFSPGPAEAQDNIALWARRAHAQGASEWHVHLLAETPEARAAAARDLAPKRRLA